LSSPFDFLIALDDEEPLLFAEKDRFARCYVKFFEELSAQNSVLNPVIPTNKKGSNGSLFCWSNR